MTPNIQRRDPKKAAAVALLALALGVPVRSQTVNSGIVSGSTVPDVELLNQHGQKVRFYSDLVKDKVVVINTIFTTCTTICPVAGSYFSRLQGLLKDQARDVNLISISVDPGTDSPERLEKWSRQYNAGPGWTLLTGQKANVDAVLKALGVYTANKQSHMPIVLIGRDGPGEWVRTSAGPEDLAKIVSAKIGRDLTSGPASKN